MSKPKIRFKGYCNDWERRKLSEVVKEVKRTDETSDAPVMMITAENGFINQSERYSTNNAGQSLKKYILLEKGELAYNHGASKLRPFGSCFALISKGKARIPFVYHCFSSKSENAEFLSLTLNGKPVERQLRRIVSSGARMDGLLNISFEEYTAIPISLPQKAEQDRIADYFRSLDCLITLHQRQCENTKKLKKFMLQKMFPKKNQKNPEIRFAGFTNDWERRKLGDIANVTKLAGFEFTEHVVYSDEGNIIALRGLNIKNGQLILDDVKYIDGSNFSKLSRSKLFIDDIMFTYVGTVGEVAIIKENDRFYLAPNVSRIRVKSDDSPKFISHYMRTDNFKNKVIFPLIATSSQPALSMENIRKFTINIPISREEQDCLAKYFDSLDHLITLHQNKCDELKKLKKFMLQNMFI